jgi:hypothetical protein
MMGSLFYVHVVRRVILAAAFLAVIAAGTSQAATTGKIAGQIVEAESGQPIPGVAVVIDGLRLGATSDPDGRYVIISVPPGTYSVSASLMGYAPVTVTRVIVNIDRTTPVDYELTESAIEVEGITVVAEREVIQLDVAGSRSTLSAEDIMAVSSVTNLASAIAREPGVSGTTIRGGLASQSQLVLNGYTLTDSRLNTFSSASIPMTSVQEVQILKSGFNAEYGNISAGVINVVTRDDNQRIWFNAHSSYTPAQKKHWDTNARGDKASDVYGPGSKEWQIFGSEASLTTPLLIDNVFTRDDLTDSTQVFGGWMAFTSTRDDSATRLAKADRFRQYWVHRHNLSNDDYANKPDYTIDATIGGPVPFVDGLSFSYSHRNSYVLNPLISVRPAATSNTEQATLTYRLGSARLSVTGSYADQSGGGSSSLALDKYAIYRGSPFDNSITLGGATFTHVLSTKTNYELKFEYQRMDYATGLWVDRFIESGVVDPMYQEHTLIGAGVEPDSALWFDINRRDPQGIAPYGHQGSPINFVDEVDPRSGHQYNLGGAAEQADSSFWTRYGFSGSITSQVTPRNQVQVGVQVNSTEYSDRQNNGVHSSPSFVWYDQGPLEISAYVQDKIEYEGMIMNVGLRLDHFDSRANTYDRDDPYSRHWEKGHWPYTVDHDLFNWLDSSAVHFEGSSLEYIVDPARTRTKISPRLAISHPITEASKVFFNYGHFYTYPTRSSVYDYRYNPSGTGVSPGPNPELDFPRTIQYELGVEREFTNSLYARLFGWDEEPQYLLSLAGYYKDETSGVGTKGYFLTNTDIRTTFENKTYALVRGFEIRFHKRIGRFLTGYFQGDWSLRDSGAIGLVTQDSLGIQEVPESAYAVTSLAEPVWSFWVDMHTPRAYTPMGMPAWLTELWSLSYEMSFSQGAQSTYNPGLLSPPPPMNVRNRDSYSSSLSLAKGFSYNNLTGEVSLNISNVLGYKTLSQAGFRGNEWEQYLRSLHFPIDDISIETDKGNDKIGDYPDYAEIPDHDDWAHFLNPRTVSMSLRLWFN